MLLKLSREILHFQQIAIHFNGKLASFFPVSVVYHMFRWDGHAMLILFVLRYSVIYGFAG